tara:strand:+ start:4083 stop:4217 length:135 start_codon:yes stop_codon:yes gene_type:complete
MNKLRQIILGVLKNTRSLKEPKIKYCINEENWNIAKTEFQQFFD